MAGDTRQSRAAPRRLHIYRLHAQARKNPLTTKWRVGKIGAGVPRPCSANRGKESRRTAIPATMDNTPTSQNEEVPSSGAQSAIFLVIAPGIVAGYVPWRISRWHVAKDFLAKKLIGGDFRTIRVGILPNT